MKKKYHERHLMTCLKADRPVVFFDSGIGGLPYLDDFRRKAPEENLVYFADTANFPYGIKTERKINKILFDAINRIIIRYDPKLIVIACNTASVTGLKFLRKNFDIPFIGVVPAVKPAAEKTVSGRIGVLATPKTVKTRYLDNLINDFASGCSVVRYGDPDIVRIVEYREQLSAETRINVLNRIKSFFEKNPVDYLILACTHYIFLRDELQDILGSNVRIIDSIDGVVRQTLKVLDGCRNSSGTDKYRIFLTSADDTDHERLKLKASQFNLEFIGRLQ